MDDHRNGRADDGTELAEALDAALAAVRRGASPAEAVPVGARRWRDLEALVRLAVALEEAPAVRPSAEFRAAARARLMARARRGGSPGGWLLRLAAGFVAIGLATGLALSAAAHAAPGEPLYGLKRASEEARIALTFDEVSRTEELLALAEEREREVTAPPAAQSAALGDAEARDYASAVLRAADALDGLSERVDPDRRRAMQERLSRHRDGLEQALARAPASAREVIRQAIGRVRPPGGSAPLLVDSGPDRTPGLGPGGRALGPRTAAAAEREPAGSPADPARESSDGPLLEPAPTPTPEARPSPGDLAGVARGPGSAAPAGLPLL